MSTYANDLAVMIATHTISETEVMNALQSEGIVSDNCVAANDVAPSDAERAVDRVWDHLDQFRAISAGEKSAAQSVPVQSRKVVPTVG